jgi:hypothetical protein
VSSLLGNARIEDVSLMDLERICKEAEKFKMELILMGGYAVRAYTKGEKLEDLLKH